MDNKTVEGLKQRLTPKWLFDQTNIFQSLSPEEKGRVHAEFESYWNAWIKYDLDTLLNNNDNGKETGTTTGDSKNG